MCVCLLLPHLQAQNQLKQLSQEISELLQRLGLNQKDVCLESWKSDVLLVAKGLLFSSRLFETHIQKSNILE